MSETAKAASEYLDAEPTGEPAPGTLYIVSTPIGNMGDITLRALRILSRVSRIAAEDTRTTGYLMKRYGIDTPSMSLFARNEIRRIPRILELLNNGESIAVVSDAGTPGISDPAALLISAAVESGIDVVPVPGASAVLSALAVSGMHTERFVFEGFLPIKKRRQTRLAEIAAEPRTVIFYESVHRIVKTLTQLHAIAGNRRVCVARELTKLHEEVFRGSLSEAIARFSSAQPKGEFTVVLQGAAKLPADNDFEEKIDDITGNQ